MTRSPDAANTHVFEAILIGLVMVAAVSFVVTFNSPTSQSEPTRGRLGAQAGDALLLMNEYPLDDARYGNNSLSKYVFEAIQGNPGNLTSRLDGLLPDAVSYNVYVNNGYAYLPAHEPKFPAGETVSVRYPLEPRLTYTWMQTVTDEVAPSLKSTLGVYALPVYNSNLLLDGGANIEVRVQGSNNGNARTFNLTAYYSTQEGPRLPAASLLWYKRTGAPGLTFDRSPGSADLGNSSFWLQVRESEGTKIRKGTTLTITGPRGFHIHEWNGTTDLATWEVVKREGTRAGGMSLTVQLKNDLVNGAVRFRYNATPVNPNLAPDVYDFYSFNARLGNGAYSVADAIVKYRTSATATGGDFHAVAASIPKPMGLSGTSRFAVAIQSPALPNPTETITVDRIEIIQPEGLRVFETVTNVGSLHGGTWSLGPAVGGKSASLVWTGRKSFTPSEMIDFVIDVKAGGATTPGVPKEHQLASLLAHTHSAAFPREIAPGLFYGEIPPNDVVLGLAGYSAIPGSDYPLISQVRPVSQKTTTLPGRWNYDVAAAASLRDSLSLINLTLSDRIVPIGSKVGINVDASNLLLNLSERGVNAQTSVRLYPPWALDQHITIRDNSIQEAGVLDTATQLLILHDYTGDGVKDVVVATADGGIYVLNGKNGYRVPGLSAKVTTGKPTLMKVGFLNTADPTYPYLVVGSEPSASGLNVYLLDKQLKQVWGARVFTGGQQAGGQTVTGLDVLSDIDGNGWLDIGVGDVTGAYYYVKGNDGTILRFGLPIAAPAGGAIVLAGTWGLGGQPGMVVTTAPSIRALNDFQLDASTFGGVQSSVKTVNFEFTDGGLLALDKDLGRIWNYGGALNVHRAHDMNADGITDVVGGDSEGSVVALNGIQAAIPYNGLTFTTGSKILDAFALDSYSVWTVGNDGMLMFTRDGMTTRSYGSDPAGTLVGGALISVPGARAIHMATKDVGYVVGDAGKVWKTTDGSDERTPAKWTQQSVSVTGRTDSSALWDFRDVWALSSSTLVVVGDCKPGCTGPVAFRSTNGGTSYLPVAGFPLGTSITRLFFVDGTTGFAGTTTGLLFRTTDAGLTWTSLGVTATGRINGIHFTSSTAGWVVGDGGFAQRVTHDGLQWKLLTSPLGITTNLNDVTFADATNGVIVGESGVVFRSHDGGATWVRLTGNSATSYTRAPYPSPYHGYILGGTSNTRFFGMLVTYASKSVAYSSASTSPPGSANWVTLTPTTRNMDGYTNVKYSVSPDGGTTWFPVLQRDAPKPDVLGNVPYHPVYVGNPGGTNLMVKMELSTDTVFPYVTPEVEAVGMTVSYMAGQTNTTVYITARFPTTGTLEPGSTAVWDSTAQGIRSPRISTFWNQKIGGEVLDIALGSDVNADGKPDVLVGTGEVIVGGVVSGSDRRAYALSGTNGAVLWKTPILPGRVKAVAFADLRFWASDAVPDAIVVVEYTAVEPNCPGSPSLTSRVYFVNGTLGTMFPSNAAPAYYRICSQWKGFAVSDLNGDLTTDAVVGQVSSISSAGFVNAVDGSSSRKLWRIVPSIKGFYNLEFEAPKNSIFGPHIVEVEVKGSETLPSGQSVETVTRAVTYFLVTPPDRVMPVSPIYTVEIVAWFDDWDFSPGAVNTRQLPPPPSNPHWTIQTDLRFTENRIE